MGRRPYGTDPAPRYGPGGGTDEGGGGGAAAVVKAHRTTLLPCHDLSRASEFFVARHEFRHLKCADGFDMSGLISGMYGLGNSDSPPTSTARTEAGFRRSRSRAGALPPSSDQKTSGGSGTAK